MRLNRALNIVYYVIYTGVVVTFLIVSNWNDTLRNIFLVATILGGTALLGYIGYQVFQMTQSKGADNLEERVHATLKWGEWKGNERYAYPTGKFWMLWREHKEEIKQLKIYAVKTGEKWWVKQYSG